MIRNLAVGWSQYQKENETDETKVRFAMGISLYLTLADEFTGNLDNAPVTHSLIYSS